MSFGSGPAGLSVVTGSAPAQGFQRVRNSELFRRRVFSCFLIVSLRVSGCLRVQFVPGMCVSISFPWKSAWVVFVRVNFVNAISREIFCVVCRPSCVGFRVCPPGRFRFADPVGFRVSCLQWEPVGR